MSFNQFMGLVISSVLVFVFLMVLGHLIRVACLAAGLPVPTIYLKRRQIEPDMRCWQEWIEKQIRTDKPVRIRFTPNLQPEQIHLIETCKLRGEFDKLDDGFFYFFPSGGNGGMSSYHLRTIADYIDAKNEDWQLVLDNDPAVSGKKV